MKQAAERKTAGREAAALFEQSTDKYKAALQMEATVAQRLDALNDLVRRTFVYPDCHQNIGVRMTRCIGVSITR